MGGKNSRYHRNTARNFAGAEMLASLAMRGFYLPPRLSPYSLRGRSVRKVFLQMCLTNVQENEILISLQERREEKQC
jgi:hypothetical protein